MNGQVACEAKAQNSPHLTFVLRWQEIPFHEALISLGSWGPEGPAQGLLQAQGRVAGAEGAHLPWGEGSPSMCQQTHHLLTIISDTILHLQELVEGGSPSEVFRGLPRSCARVSTQAAWEAGECAGLGTKCADWQPVGQKLPTDRQLSQHLFVCLRLKYTATNFLYMERIH